MIRRRRRRPLSPSIYFACVATGISLITPAGHAYHTSSTAGVDFHNDFTTSQQAALAWCPRISGSLSLIGAVLILFDILSRQERRKRVYCQIVCGMAISDLLTAIPWIIGSAAVPEFTIDADGTTTPTGAYGAKGNEGTCKLQGFFIQLGLGSFLYNASLSIYYWLVIVRGWKESRLKRAVKYFHAAPVLITALFAFGGLPLYDWLPFVCHMQLYPIDEHLVEIFVFILIPIFVTVTILTSALLHIYWYVCKTEQKAQRYLYGDKVSLQRRVFWQSFAYLLAFYVTWPSVLAGTLLAGTRGHASFGYSVVLLLVIPMQGLSNAIVFFRYRINHYVRNIIARQKCAVATGIITSAALFPKSSDQAQASNVTQKPKPDGLTAAVVGDVANDEQSSLPALNPKAPHVPEVFVSPLSGCNESSDDYDVPMDIELGTGISHSNRRLSGDSSLDPTLGTSTKLGGERLGGELERNAHYSTISRVTSNINGSVLVHIPIQTTEDPDDDVSLVLSMMELNRHESKESKSFMIPTTALSRNRSGEYVPMKSFSRHHNITAADPSIAIALDDEEVAEVFMPPMPELKVGVSLDSSAIDLHMRRSGDLTLNVKRRIGNHNSNHKASLLDDSPNVEIAHFDSIFQGLGGDGDGGHGKRLSVINSVTGGSSNHDLDLHTDGKTADVRFPRRIVSKRRSTTHDVLNRGLSVRDPSFFRNYSKAEERE